MGHRNEDASQRTPEREIEREWRRQHARAERTAERHTQRADRAAQMGDAVAAAQLRSEAAREWAAADLAQTQFRLWQRLAAGESDVVGAQQPNQAN